jgi:hypothetical protein
VVRRVIAKLVGGSLAKNIARVDEVRSHKDRGLHPELLEDWKYVHPIIEVAIVEGQADRWRRVGGEELRAAELHGSIPDAMQRLDLASKYVDILGDLGRHPVVTPKTHAVEHHTSRHKLSLPFEEESLNSA